MILKEFSQVPVPIKEMEEFYAIEDKNIPLNRPYIWYMFVMSADGVGSLLERAYKDPGIGLSGPGIALKQFRDRRPEAIGAYVDSELLQYGWAIADAVLAGSGVLKAEPYLTWMPWDKRFLDYRRDLGKDAALRVVVTGSGFTAKEMEYPVFRPDNKTFATLIATSESGYERMQREMESMHHKPTAEFRIFGEERVDFKKMLKVLRGEYKVKFLDLQGGPDIGGQFLNDELVDEYRITISPGIAGSINSEGKQRPTPVKTSFGPENLLTMSLLGLGVHGSHTFHRYKVNYSH